MAEENNNFLPQASQRVVDKIREEGAGYYNPVVWHGMIKLAKVLMDAGACPVGLKTEAQVMVALQAGREVGLSPINALNSFYIVKGKVSIYGDSAIAVVLRDGHQIDWGKCDANSATVKITRGDNAKSMETTFTYADAENKGITKYADGRKNEFWLKYPENMLKFKAFGSIARFIVADSLRGMSIKEELEGSSIDGEIVEEVKTPRVTEPAKDVKAEEVTPIKTDEEIDEGASLTEFVNKEPEKKPEPEKKRTKAELVKDINKLCLDNGKDPKKILEHYKKKTWFDFKLEDLVKVEESVKLSVKPATEVKKVAEVKEEKQTLTEATEELPTYYMPEEDVLEIVNELMAHEGATDLSEAQQNLLNDVGDDRFLGKKDARYKDIF